MSTFTLANFTSRRKKATTAQDKDTQVITYVSVIGSPALSKRAAVPSPPSFGELSEIALRYSEVSCIVAVSTSICGLAVSVDTRL